MHGPNWNSGARRWCCYTRQKHTKTDYVAKEIWKTVLQVISIFSSINEMHIRLFPYWWRTTHSKMFTAINSYTIRVSGFNVLIEQLNFAYTALIFPISRLHVISVVLFQIIRNKNGALMFLLAKFLNAPAPLHFISSHVFWWKLFIWMCLSSFKVLPIFFKTTC